MAKRNLLDFLNDENIRFQNQSFFEFRYPILFDDDSFLIEQLDFPKIDTNIGQVYLDGYAIPIHSTAKFDNSLSFTMYVNESDWMPGGKYDKVFYSLLDYDHRFDHMGYNYYEDSYLVADIIPLSASPDIKTNLVEDHSKSFNEKTIRLHNAMINSISLQGGFTSNATTLSKFSVSLSYAFFEKTDNDFMDF